MKPVYRRGEVGQTARALRLLDALRGFKHGRTLEELATKLGVSERTVRRDLEELADATSASSSRVSMVAPRRACWRRATAACP